MSAETRRELTKLQAMFFPPYSVTNAYFNKTHYFRDRDKAIEYAECLYEQGVKHYYDIGGY